MGTSYAPARLGGVAVPRELHSEFVGGLAKSVGNHGHDKEIWLPQAVRKLEDLLQGNYR